MEPLLLGLQSQLEDMKGTLMELKAENAVLRNEILGIGSQANFIGESVGLLEKKTLREFVEEIQFDVKSIKAEIRNWNQERESGLDQGSLLQKCAPSFKGNKVSISGDSLDEHPVVEIERKTMEEERAWMNLKFNEERATVREAVDGSSLEGKTVEFTTDSMQLPTKVRTSCVLKLSNHLDYDLTTPQVYVPSGRKISGGLNAIVAHTIEAFSFQGNISGNSSLITFGISNSLRLTVACIVFNSGKVHLRLAFTPEGLQTSRALLAALDKLKPVPDVYTSDEYLGDGPLECFINHGLLLARAQMSPGPRALVQVDILEVKLPRSVGMVGTPATTNNVEGLIQITNYLKVALKNPRAFTPTPDIENAWPTEVLPLTQETFFRCSNWFVEAMISYEIESTDLGLVVAFRVQENDNAFSAAFVQLPAETNQRKFNLAMNQEQWKSHLYRKYAKAQQGEQEIQMRNIRARVRMTDGEKPQLKVRIFAV